MSCPTAKAIFKVTVNHDSGPTTYRFSDWFVRGLVVDEADRTGYGEVYGGESQWDAMVNHLQDTGEVDGEFEFVGEHEITGLSPIVRKHIRENYSSGEKNPQSA